MKFIKSSVKVKADPLYYKRIADSCDSKRAVMFAEVEANEAASGREDKGGRVKIDRLSAKIQWACSRIAAAQTIRAEERRYN